MDELDEQKLRDARTDLLGAVLGAALSGVATNGRAVAAAPRLADQLVFSRRAAADAERADRLVRLTGEDGAELAREATRSALADFTQHVHTDDFAQLAVRAVLLDGLVADLRERVQLPTEVAEALDGPDTPDAREVLAAALEADPAHRGAVALYGRRLLGEAMSQAQRVASANPGLAMLLTGRTEGDDVAAVAELMAELATGHTHRMAELGL